MEKTYYGFRINKKMNEIKKDKYNNKVKKYVVLIR